MNAVDDRRPVPLQRSEPESDHRHDRPADLDRAGNDLPAVLHGAELSAFDRATALPGFPPVDSFLQFLIVTTIIQGALFRVDRRGFGHGNRYRGRLLRATDRVAR